MVRLQGTLPRATHFTHRPKAGSQHIRPQHCGVTTFLRPQHCGVTTLIHPQHCGVTMLTRRLAATDVGHTHPWLLSQVTHLGECMSAPDISNQSTTLPHTTLTTPEEYSPYRFLHLYTDSYPAFNLASLLSGIINTK